MTWSSLLWCNLVLDQPKVEGYLRVENRYTLFIAWAAVDNFCLVVSARTSTTYLLFSSRQESDIILDWVLFEHLLVDPRDPLRHLSVQSSEHNNKTNYSINPIGVFLSLWKWKPVLYNSQTKTRFAQQLYVIDDGVQGQGTMNLPYSTATGVFTDEWLICGWPPPQPSIQ